MPSVFFGGDKRRLANAKVSSATNFEKTINSIGFASSHEPLIMQRFSRLNSIKNDLARTVGSI